MEIDDDRTRIYVGQPPSGFRNPAEVVATPVSTS
jgi:hypothetical protein